MENVQLPLVERFLFVDEYRGELKSNIAAVKYRNDRSILPAMAWHMAQLLRNELSGDFVLTWLPTTKEHIDSRGFDHAYRLARMIGLFSGVAPRRVFQNRVGNPQTGRSRAERLGSVRFVIKRPSIVAGKTVVLVDDVCTTGTTMCAGARSTKAAGALRSIALVAAYTPSRPNAHSTQWRR